MTHHHRDASIWPDLQICNLRRAQRHNMRPLEEAQVGETLRPHTYILTREAALFAARNIGKDSLETDASGHEIAPACITDSDYVPLWISDFTTKEAVHAKAEHHYLNPPRVGKQMTVTGRFSDKYNRRGRDFLTMESETIDEDGNKIVESKNVLLIDL